MDSHQVNEKTLNDDDDDDQGLLDPIITFDIENDLMSGLLRVSTADNSSYRKHFELIQNLKREYASSLTVLSKVQIMNNIAKEKAYLLSLIKKERERISSIGKGSSIIFTNVNYVIELKRSGYLIRQNERPFKTLRDPKNSVGDLSMYVQSGGPSIDPTLSFGIPHERQRITSASNNLREGGILGFIMWYLLSPETGSERKSWSKVDSIRSNPSNSSNNNQFLQQQQQQVILRQRKGTALAFETVYQHVNKLRAAFRWLFFHRKLDYFDIASLQDSLLTSQHWEAFFYAISESGRHTKLKTVVAYFEALEWLWISINSQMYPFTGLSKEQAQRHPFWIWITTEISRHRSDMYAAHTRQCEFLNSSGIREQTLPDKNEIQLMWNYSVEKYLKRLLFMIKQITEKTYSKEKKLSVRLLFEFHLTDGYTIKSLHPRWKKFHSNLCKKFECPTDDDGNIINLNDDAQKFLHEMITLWQKLLVAIFYCGIPCGRSSDINNLYYETRLEPQSGTQQEASIKPIWKNPDNGEFIDFKSTDSEPFLQIQYMSKKVFIQPKILYCVYGTEFWRLYYWMCNIFAKNLWGNLYSNHILFDFKGQCISLDKAHCLLQEIYSEAIGENSGKVSIQHVSPSLFRKAASAIGNTVLGDAAAIAACQNHSLHVVSKYYDPSVMSALVHRGQVEWQNKVLESPIQQQQSTLPKTKSSSKRSIMNIDESEIIEELEKCPVKDGDDCNDDDNVKVIEEKEEEEEKSTEKVVDDNNLTLLSSDDVVVDVVESLNVIESNSSKKHKSKHTSHIDQEEKESGEVVYVKSKKTKKHLQKTHSDDASETVLHVDDAALDEDDTTRKKKKRKKKKKSSPKPDADDVCED